MAMKPSEILKLASLTKPVSPLAQLAPELPFDEIWIPEPEANLVIPGLGIAPGPVHLVTGSWYTGKTLLLATFGLCVAGGKDVFGLHRVRQGKWIHFDHEMGRRSLKRYTQRLRAGLNIDVDDLRDRVSLRVLPQLNLRSPDALAHYTELLDGCAVATIDPLRAAAPGADENKSEFREYLDMLAIVSDRTKCSVFVLHHGGKPVEGAQRRNTGRGTSAIDDAAQSKFVLTAEEKGAPMLVTHEKTRELTGPLEDFYLEIVNAPDSVCLVHRSAEEFADALATKKHRRDAERAVRARDAVRAMLAKHAGVFPGTRDELVAMVGGDRNIVSKVVTEMRVSGEVVYDRQNRAIRMAV